MAELLLHLLWGQALLLTMALAAMALLRRARLWLGASLTYAAWGLVPLVLLVQALPKPELAVVRALLLPQPLEAAPPVRALAWQPVDQVPWLLALWLVGAVGATALLAAQQWRVRRLGAVLPAGSSPAWVGVCRPYLALPADFSQRFTNAQQALVLAHEDVHRRRLDNAWNLIASALLALHWWNPAVWWAVRAFRADQELACDAAVLHAQPDARASYAEALLIAHGLHTLVAPVASRWGAVHPLVERISMLQHLQAFSRRRALTVAGIGVLAIAAAGSVRAVTSAAPTAGVVLKLKVESSTRAGATETKLSATPTLELPAGATGTVLLGATPQQPGPDQLQIEIQAEPQAEGRVLLSARVSRGAPLKLMSSPRLLTLDGQLAVIEIGDQDPANTHHLRVEVTPTVLKAPG
ncbi:M56 family metallopeptidase [Roseateles paludis]|uniref:M56 family metallopeptidase n=1 Tax=Roseateles paludis TaxID=3145238 RepID=A0ABV0G054_9BURK